jgi:3-carboxy-cis,cis-muconate cycloisomerase
MAAAHERPAGLWHAEWHALPQLFGLASGALHEARTLAEGLEVDTDRMRANLDATRGLLFADAVAARLAPQIGRESAHDLVEHAAAQVRTSGAPLHEVLANDPALAQPGADTLLNAAFDLTPATNAAAAWTDRALAAADRISERLSSSEG